MSSYLALIQKRFAHKSFIHLYLVDLLAISHLPQWFILGADVSLLLGLAVNVELLAQIHGLNVLEVSSGNVLIFRANIILIIDTITIRIKQAGISSLCRFSLYSSLS